MEQIRRPIETALVISFFVSSIFFGFLYFVSPIIKFDIDTIKTTFHYLFSTNAQTLAALIGIGYALLYTTLTNLKNNVNSIYNEPLKKLLFSDPILIACVLLGVLSIILSLLSLIIINIIDSFVTSIPIFLIAFLVINSSISAILLLTYFSLFKYKLYLEPQRLVSIRKGENIKQTISLKMLVPFTELTLLLETNKEYYFDHHYSLKFLEYYAPPNLITNYYYYLFHDLIKDVNKIITDDEKKSEYYCKLIESLWFS